MGAFIDLTNKTFGKWTVIKQEGKKNNQLYWLCKCECGTIKTVNGNSLRNGSSTNCGCVRKEKMSNFRENLLGQKFNSLTVIKKANNGLWECKCDCGKITYVNTNNLKNNHIKRCKQCGYIEGAKKRTNNLLGQKFGLLTVIDQAPSDNHGTKWICQCKCGTIKEIAGTSLNNGLTKSCGCLKSKGEQAIIKILQENNIPYIYQKRFENCRFPNTNSQAIFDFYVDNHYIIEYDGQQHFSYTGNGWCTKEQYESLQKRDNFKNQWCKENNIPLIRIPYTHLNSICLNDLLIESSNFLKN